MEKPRKMILDCPFCNEVMTEFGGGFGHTKHNKSSCPIAGQFFDNAEVNAWNTRPAMSTWIEGEVPTKDSIELEIHRYFDKGLKSDKPTNITIDFLAQAIHALITQKLTGKV